MIPSEHDNEYLLQTNMIVLTLEIVLLKPHVPLLQSLLSVVWSYWPMQWNTKQITGKWLNFFLLLRDHIMIKEQRWINKKCISVFQWTNFKT